MEIRYQSTEAIHIEPQGDPSQHRYVIKIGEQGYSVQVNHFEADTGELVFTVDREHIHAYTADDGPHRYVALGSDVYTLTKADPSRRKRTVGSGDNNLAAVMPGQIVKVQVAEGDSVTRGQLLIVLEAMKMEIRVTAPHDGRVARILCKAGQIVDRGQTLLELADAPG